MKKLKKIPVILLFLLFIPPLCAIAKDASEIKEQALALYATKNYTEAGNLLENLSTAEKDEEVFLILANIAQSKGDVNHAIQNLNKALDKNNGYYKAYYNLGCIFASKNSYFLALDNFKLALKYNKNFLEAYYNLAYCEIKLEDYKNAKKHLIKALQIDPINKECLYNLAYCYKKLNKEKQAKKIIETYNRLG